MYTGLSTTYKRSGGGQVGRHVIPPPSPRTLPQSTLASTAAVCSVRSQFLQGAAGGQWTVQGGHTGHCPVQFGLSCVCVMVIGSQIKKSLTLPSRHRSDTRGRHSTYLIVHLTNFPVSSANLSSLSGDQVCSS